MTKVQTRIACPYCSEEIIASAKKCRFCGEWLVVDEIVVKPKNFAHRPISIKAFILTWILSLIVFFILLIYANQYYSDLDSPTLWFILFLGNIVVGGIAFVGLFLGLINAIFSKKKRKQGVQYLIVTTLIFFGFFGCLYAYVNKYAQSYPNSATSCQAHQIQCLADDGKQLGCLASTQCEQAKKDYQNASSCSSGEIYCTIDGLGKCTSVDECQKKTVPTKQNSLGNISTTSSNSNQIECIGPDGKHFNTSMDECKNLNEKWGKPVDYMTNCNIHPDCGGGTERMPKSQCDKPCSGKTTNSNSAAVSNQQTTPTSRLNFYCYDNSYNYSYYTSSGEQCNLDNAKSLCRKTVNDFIYDPCMDKCLSEANDLSAYCIYNISESEQEACLEEKGGIHQECMDACGKTFQEEMSKCD